MSSIQVGRSWVYERMDNLSSYFSLKKENEQLRAENTKLNNQLHNQHVADSLIVFSPYDIIQGEVFTYLPARVVQISTNQLQNFLIINVGRNQGVSKDMAVVSADGAVGVVTKTSDNYATVLPIINVDSHTSAKLLSTNSFGTLVWKGNSYREVNLTDIPLHISVEKGDTVLTSGHSLVFPQGIMLGTVEAFEVKKGNFYEIKIALSVDYKRLQNVYVLKSDSRAEIDSLSVGGYK